MAVHIEAIQEIANQIKEEYPTLTDLEAFKLAIQINNTDYLTDEINTLTNTIDLLIECIEKQSTRIVAAIYNE